MEHGRELDTEKQKNDEGNGLCKKGLYTLSKAKLFPENNLIFGARLGLNPDLAQLTMTLAKLFNLFITQFFHLENENDNSIYLIGLLWGLNESEQSLTHDKHIINTSYY